MTDEGPAPGESKPIYTQMGGGDEPAAWGVGEAIGFAWERESASFLNVVLTNAVGGIVAAFPTILWFVFCLSAAAQRHGGSVAFVTGPARFIGHACTMATFFTGALMQGGIARFSLKLARGEDATFADLFAETRSFGPILLVGVFTSAPFSLMLGFVNEPGLLPRALVLPLQLFVGGAAITLTLAACLAVPLVVDRRLGGVAAVRESFRLTSGSRLRLFGLFVAVALLTMVGLCACGVGALVGGPIWSIGVAFVYLRLTGQPTAARSVPE